MSTATDALRLELERQRGYLKHADANVTNHAELLVACQTDAARLRTKIADLEAAIILLERPNLASVQTKRL